MAKQRFEADIRYGWPVHVANLKNNGMNSMPASSGV
jgi:hypothetical protein